MRDDPGRLGSADLYRHRSPRWDIAILGLLIVVALTLAVWVATIPPRREPVPTCPDGYALAGGTIFSGALHCVPGAPVEWR